MNEKSSLVFMVQRLETHPNQIEVQVSQSSETLNRVTPDLVQILGATAA